MRSGLPLKWIVFSTWTTYRSPTCITTTILKHTLLSQPGPKHAWTGAETAQHTSITISRCNGIYARVVSRWEFNVQRPVGERRDLLRQSLDDAIANSRSEVDDSPTVTLDSVRKTGKRDDFPSVSVSNPRSLKRPRPEEKEKEKEKEAARDKDWKALEVKIKALEEQWVRNRKEIQALKHKYEEIHVKVEALERELRGGSIYVIRI
ncbi:uncharacterized protein BKA55DRAFT_732760 [Fusarium redolens]|uniref:Uncharacterized protein n=1 Tax=Fusarium redolens TaxID=48865 RepID=A0A9P9RA58_FUSRE|nr:uncharacterized protein BKA55DRAFT_732760 [Fusarium redolens]KAH7270655.1 hypothetical protein BKA55DRAFT_732760 [Fusarium redolens]